MEVMDYMCSIPESNVNIKLHSASIIRRTFIVKSLILQRDCGDITDNDHVGKTQSRLFYLVLKIIY